MFPQPKLKLQTPGKAGKKDFYLWKRLPISRYTAQRDCVEFSFQSVAVFALLAKYFRFTLHCHFLTHIQIFINTVPRVSTKNGRHHVHLNCTQVTAHLKCKYLWLFLVGCNSQTMKKCIV
jgi:hypothetical protein